MHEVYGDTADPECQISQNPDGERLEPFDDNFKAYLAWLYEIDMIQRGGYQFGRDELTAVDWKCLAIIKEWREAERSKMKAGG